MLRIAKVLDTGGDPEGQRRIKVGLPDDRARSKEVWMRIASPYATKGAGLTFLPEVGDEVVIGFLGDDPETGIILGSLNSAATAATPADDTDNDQKAIVTRSQVKITFDDEKKTLSIETPGNQSVTLDDDAKTVTLTDMTGNRVELGDGGITLDSKKDIKITAAASISLDAKTDVSIKGLNATIDGQAQATLKGGSSAELSSGGQTTVKGAIVMIN